MNRRFTLIPEWLRRLLTTPVAELTRWQYALRFFLELCRQGAVQLQQDRAGQMAAALAFRTVFGLVPVVVIAILIFRGFGGMATFTDLIDRLVASARLQDVAGPEEGTTLAQWARGLITSIDATLSAKALGLVGGLVVAWAAIGLLTTIERCFNTICQAPQHRTLARRLPLYWTVVTVGPALLYLSFQVETRFVELVVHWGFGPSLASLIGTVTGLLSTWLFLFGLYSLMPHTRMNAAASGVGSFVATIFWAIAVHLFGRYIRWSFSGGSSAFAVLYGSLGLIPVFLFWVYLLWLIVLYGLEITQLWKTVRGKLDRPIAPRPEAPPVLDPAAVVPLMKIVSDRFARGVATGTTEIVEQTRLNQAAVEMFVAALVEAKLLHRVDQAGEPVFVLARPAEAITTSEVLKVVQRLTELTPAESGTAWDWVTRFHAAQLELAVHRTLAKV